MSSGSLMETRGRLRQLTMTNLIFLVRLVSTVAGHFTARSCGGVNANNGGQRIGKTLNAYG